MPNSKTLSVLREAKRRRAIVEVLRCPGLMPDAAALFDGRDMPFRFVEVNGQTDVVGEQGVTGALFDTQ
ncbi:MAG: hypothetical protein MRJ92_07210 [Nitrospira sp.]|nr:hypothetical protein [Nitrospira sp.]